MYFKENMSKKSFEEKLQVEQYIYDELKKAFDSVYGLDKAKLGEQLSKQFSKVTHIKKVIEGYDNPPAKLGGNDDGWI